MDGALLFWGALALLLIACAIYLLRRRRNYRTALAVTLLCALVPIVIVGGDCLERAVSEACVWGKAFLPAYLGFMLLFAAPLLYLLVTAAAAALRHITDHRSNP